MSVRNNSIKAENMTEMEIIGTRDENYVIAGYIAAHGMSRISDEDIFKAIIQQAIVAASEDISLKDMVALINVVVASHKD